MVVAVGQVACGRDRCGAALAARRRRAAETLESALVQAYQNNPTLNSQRAAVRATDEGVPQALSGYRPKVRSRRRAASRAVIDHRKVGHAGLASR